MKVILAETFGMCFGVRDALRRVAEVEEPTATTIHGELVHNEVVLYQLAQQGFAQMSEEDRDTLPNSPNILITAHGISDRERRRLRAAQKTLIDTTCPLVRRVHVAAWQLQRDGYFVVVLGKPGHVEVRGIVEDLSDFAVVDRVENVRNFGQPKLGIVCQTTLPPALSEQLRARIVECNPTSEIRCIDTICEPTRQRQEAMQELLQKVPAVVIVGGHNSNNTRQLLALCHANDIPAKQVAAAAELDLDWLSQWDVVGLTAGTSTLDETLQEVRKRLLQFHTGVA